jgi:hypothetical protein
MSSATFTPATAHFLLPQAKPDAVPVMKLGESHA